MKKCWIGLFLMAVACSGGQTTRGADDGGSGTDQLKKAAADERASSGVPTGICESEGWYGDGECDTFCADADSKDCTENSDGVVCALFVEEANGFCSRRLDDPCIDQDPDCHGLNDPGIICPAIAQAADGVCQDNPENPCVYLTDPDCWGSTEPGQPSEPTYCAAIVQESDGVCKDDPANQCARYQDPDCWRGNQPSPDEPVACALYVEKSDGVCSRDPNDPCIGQDPDCSMK